MTSAAGDLTRLLRAVVASSVVIGFGASAHQLGGGAPLQVIPALVLGVLVGPLVWLLVRRRTTVVRMVAATGLGQVVTHLALTGMTPRSGGSAQRLHLHEVAAPLPLLPSETSTPLSVTGTMLLAHAVATVLAGLVLTVGADLVRVVVRRLCATPDPVRAEPDLPPTVVVGIPGRVLDGRVVGPVGGRAPPLRLA